MSNTYTQKSSQGIAYVDGAAMPRGDWDFIGFRYGDFSSFNFGENITESRENFNDIMSHCSKWGIKRVQNGLLTENNIPDFNDSTIKTTGANETYYFGSEYTQRQFSINFAFDGMTEEQFLDLKRTFVSENPKNLIFDEFPYKMYTVKLNSPMQINYICFEENGKRIYKGEGNLDFIAYYPFAKSPFKNISGFDTVGYNVSNEWVSGSGLESTNSSGYTSNYTNNNGIITKTFNIESFGEKSTPFKLIVSTPIERAKITISAGTETNMKTKMHIDFIAIDPRNNYFVVDSKTHLVSNLGKTDIFNDCIDYGDFFELTPFDKILKVQFSDCGNEPVDGNISLNYECLYY